MNIFIVLIHTVLNILISGLICIVEVKCVENSRREVFIFFRIISIFSLLVSEFLSRVVVAEVVHSVIDVGVSLVNHIKCLSIGIISHDWQLHCTQDFSHCILIAFQLQFFEVNLSQLGFHKLREVRVFTIVVELHTSERAESIGEERNASLTIGDLDHTSGIVSPIVVVVVPPSREFGVLVRLNDVFTRLNPDTHSARVVVVPVVTPSDATTLDAVESVRQTAEVLCNFAL